MTPVLGKNLRIRIGQGANVVNLQGGVGAITVNNTGVIQSDAFLGNDLLRRFGMSADYNLQFDRQILSGQQNIQRWTDFLLGWKNRTAADMGELVVDFVLWGVPDVLWMRKIVKGPQTLNQPQQNIASITGSLMGEENWAGTAGTMETINRASRIPSDDTAITWDPQQGQGGLVLLTYAREGDSSLQLHYKRGAGNWTLVNEADANLASDVSTVGSAVSLDAIIPRLQKDDLVKVRFGSTVTATDSWSGRLAACYPEVVR